MCVTLQERVACVALEERVACVTLEERVACVTLQERVVCVSLQERVVCVTLQEQVVCRGADLQQPGQRTVSLRHMYEFLPSYALHRILRKAPLNKAPSHEGTK
jgi:hypothetical protein